MKLRSGIRSFGVVMLTAAMMVTGSLAGFTTANAAAPETIEYKGQTVTLSEHALYVDSTLAETGNYSFKSLQDAVSAAVPGTKTNPTVIYLAPDVYWTDDYSNPADRDKDDLIGLIIPQAYITLVGMTGDPEDVVIASDRGQNAGANGNFNTIGVGDGFHAKDLTIGNYCNVDLNYKLDPSKSHTKRQESITQAQAVTKVPGLDDMDEWYFENCHIISRLNLFSRDERPKRSLLKDCHLECTDDSLGTGYITIFQNCTFNLYSNTPCGGASFYMQAFLGCEFTTELSDNKTITLCKNTKPFAFIDCAFSGDMTGMEWKPSNLSDDLRQIVSGNTLNGQPLVISPSRPELSVTPDEEQMKAFKYNGEYNIYNLLNGAGYEEWDPLNQKDAMPTSAWNIQFDYPGIAKDEIPVLEGNEKDSLEVTPIVFGGDDKSVTWSTEDDTLKIEPQSNGNVIVKGVNQTDDNKSACLIATAANGMKKVLHFTVTPAIEEAPVLKEVPVLSQPQDGKITVSYDLSGNGDIRDISQINWYRAGNPDGSDKVLVAQTTYVKDDAKPYVSYTLRLPDVDNYIFCEIIPQKANSLAGTAVLSAASAKISASDVAQKEKEKYVVDLEHLTYVEAENDAIENNYEWLTSMESGKWYGGFYLPAEYREGGIWSDKAYKPAAGELPYTFAQGASGAAGTVGLQTTTQGARLVYVDDVARKDMRMTLTLSPHKTAAQGFGSAKQFIDIYFKYDAKTMSGYGLRIARVPDIADPDFKDYAAKSCTFTLMEYKNGVATPLEDGVVSTAFLPGCKVDIDMTGNVLTVDVTTTTPQDSAYPGNMPHEVHIKHTFDAEVNSYSGFGFQHTGTAGAGKSGNRTTIHSVEVDYKGVTGEPETQEPDDPKDDEKTDEDDGDVSDDKPEVQQPSVPGQDEKPGQDNNGGSAGESKDDGKTNTDNGGGVPTGDTTAQKIIFFGMLLILSAGAVFLSLKKRKFIR